MSDSASVSVIGGLTAPTISAPPAPAAPPAPSVDTLVPAPPTMGPQLSAAIGAASKSPDFSAIPGHVAVSAPEDHSTWQRVKDWSSMPESEYTRKYAADDAATNARIQAIAGKVIPLYSEMSSVQAPIERTKVGRQAGQFIKEQLAHPEQFAMGGEFGAGAAEAAGEIPGAIKEAGSKALEAVAHPTEGVAPAEGNPEAGVIRKGKKPAPKPAPEPVGAHADDLPYRAKYQDVDFSAQDLQDSEKKVTADTVRKDYAKGKKTVSVYQSYIPMEDLPRPEFVEPEEEQFDRADYVRPRDPVPIKVQVDKAGKLAILDGNHRAQVWEEQGQEYAPAWVIDKRHPGIENLSEDEKAERAEEAEVAEAAQPQEYDNETGEWNKAKGDPVARMDVNSLGFLTADGKVRVVPERTQGFENSIYEHRDMFSSIEEMQDELRNGGVRFGRTPGTSRDAYINIAKTDPETLQRAKDILNRMPVDDFHLSVENPKMSASQAEFNGTAKQIIAKLNQKYGEGTESVPDFSSIPGHVQVESASLPPQPRLPEEGQFAAIQTDDGGIYPDTQPEKQRTHVMLAKDLGIPAERIVSGGWLKDGVYEGTERSDAGRYGEQARARQTALAHRAAAQTTQATDEFGLPLKAAPAVESKPNIFRAYHGTTTPVEFEEFSTEGPPAHGDEETGHAGTETDPTAYLGAHFAKEPQIANKFAVKSERWLQGRVESEGGEKPRVIPVDLSLKNPKNFGSESNLNQFIYEGDLNRAGYAGEELLNAAMEADGIEAPYDGGNEVDKWMEKYDSDSKFRAEQNEWIFQSHRGDDDHNSLLAEAAPELASQAKSRLSEMGHDGVIYKNEVEGGTGYIAFHPEQIKSAFDFSSIPGHVALNASGESSASQEAISRLAAEKASRVTRVRVDTRSGREIPIFGVDAIDAQPAAYEKIIRREPGKPDIVLNTGSKARP